MVKAENIVFQAKCWIPSGEEETGERVNELKHGIKAFLNPDFYETSGVKNPFVEDRFTRMKFIRNVPQEYLDRRDRTFTQSLRELFGGKDQVESELLDELYNQWRIDIPHTLGISFNLTKNRINMRLVLKPVAYIHIAQNKMQFADISEDRYGIIRETNVQFLNSVMEAIHARVEEKPQAKSEMVKFPLSELLERRGFENLATTVNQGYRKIEKDNYAEGITDLRTVLEKLLRKLAEELTAKSSGKTDLSTNLNQKILQELNLKSRYEKILRESIDTFLYGFGSEQVHNRDNSDAIANETEAKFYFHTFENCMEFLLREIDKKQ